MKQKYPIGAETCKKGRKAKKFVAILPKLSTFVQAKDHTYCNANNNVSLLYKMYSYSSKI